MVSISVLVQSAVDCCGCFPECLSVLLMSSTSTVNRPGTKYTSPLLLSIQFHTENRERTIESEVAIDSDVAFALLSGRFAQLIGTREHAVYRWRISKNANQNSQIIQESIDN